MVLSASRDPISGNSEACVEAHERQPGAAMSAGSYYCFYVFSGIFLMVGDCWYDALMQVSEVAARIVGAPVPVAEPLMQAGLDSLAAVDLRQELIATFDLNADALSPTLVFDYPSVEAIAEHLLPLLPAPPALPPAEAAQAEAGVPSSVHQRLTGAARRQHVLQQVSS